MLVSSLRAPNPWVIESFCPCWTIAWWYDMVKTHGKNSLLENTQWLAQNTFESAGKATCRVVWAVSMNMVILPSGRDLHWTTQNSLFSLSLTLALRLFLFTSVLNHSRRSAEVEFLMMEGVRDSCNMFYMSYLDAQALSGHFTSRTSLTS